MSVVNIGRESVDGFTAGHGTVGATPAQLSEINWPCMKHIVVRAAAENEGTITVGPNEGDAANGFVLAGGEQTPPIYVGETNQVWIVGSDADQAFSWIAN